MVYNYIKNKDILTARRASARTGRGNREEVSEKSIDRQQMPAYRRSGAMASVYRQEGLVEFGLEIVE